MPKIKTQNKAQTTGQIIIILIIYMEKLLSSD